MKDGGHVETRGKETKREEGARKATRGEDVWWDRRREEE